MIESDSNSRPAVTKESNSIETRNTNKKEMLESYLTLISSTQYIYIISFNTIIEYYAY